MINAELMMRMDGFRERVASTCVFEKGELPKLRAELRATYAERLKATKADPFSIIVKLQERKDGLVRETGKNPSVPHTVASLIDIEALSDMQDVYIQLSTLSPTDPEPEVLGRGIITYDSILGRACASSAISIAEGELTKGSDQTAQGVVELYSNNALVPPSITSQTRSYLILNDDSKVYSRLLKQDRTGNKLMEYVARRYRNSSEALKLVPPYMLKDFVAIGAQFAVDQYKIFYQLAEK